MARTTFSLGASPARVLGALGGEIDALVSEPARARLLRGANILALPARTVCLECRLDDDERVDLALCLATRTEGLEDALLGLGRRYPDDVDWQSCLRLLGTWARGDDVSLAAVPFLYAAVDLATGQLPVPCLSLCADPSFFMRRLGLPVARAPRELPVRLLKACGASLDASWLTPEVFRRLEACLGDTADLEVRQLSLMLGRRPATVKLDVTLPFEHLAGFLGATGWRGNADDVSRQTRGLAVWQRRIQLNYVLNSGSETQPLEVELCCTGPDEPTLAERAALLDELTALGLVRPRKASALRDLLRQPIIVADDGLWLARNWYLKLRFEQGRFSGAKAYIGLTQRSSGDSLSPRLQSLSGS